MFPRWKWLVRRKMRLLRAKWRRTRKPTSLKRKTDQSNMSKKKNERHIKRKQMIGFFIITLAFVFILVFVFPYLKTVQPVPVQKGSVEAVTPVFSARHPLTGSLISQDIELPQVYGVMIDNHPEARPQSGLDQAFLVIEAPVEGGISRLLAFFSAEQVLEE